MNFLDFRLEYKFQPNEYIEKILRPILINAPKLTKFEADKLLKEVYDRFYLYVDNVEKPKLFSGQSYVEGENIIYKLEDEYLKLYGSSNIWEIFKMEYSTFMEHPKNKMLELIDIANNITKEKNTVLSAKLPNLEEK